MKQILKFLIVLLPWFIPILFNLDYSFYNSIKLPFFAPPAIVFSIVWTILYILIAISIVITTNNYRYDELPKEYKLSLFINFICNISFTFIFFGLKNFFLGFVSCLLTFISSLYFYTETRNLNEKGAHLLVPYIIWTLFATFLSLTIYILNV